MTEEAKFEVKVTPKAGRTRLTGWREDVLLAQVTAPPAEGEANEALLRLLARLLSVPVSRVRIASGWRSRQKLVSVEGLTLEEVRERLG